MDEIARLQKKRRPASYSELWHRTNSQFTTPEEEEDLEVELKTYKRRYLVCLAFAVNNMASAITWITFAPIQSRSAEFHSLPLLRGVTPLTHIHNARAPKKINSYFHTNQEAINMLSTVFMIFYIPGSLLCGWMFKKWGLRYSFIFSSLIQTIGCLIRWGACSSSFRRHDDLRYGSQLPSPSSVEGTFLFRWIPGIINIHTNQ